MCDRFCRGQFNNQPRQDIWQRWDDKGWRIDKDRLDCGHCCLLVCGERWRVEVVEKNVTADPKGSLFT